ncbi:UNVERIFIED_CONTAM: hypothetical protein HDU68_006995 [Siphonaria sp. JEL0065]|nr:hypothetical protein HDU68_006995 [Siphonaria sp. JEL0065]
MYVVRFDENYEPTDDEVLEYARFLGMDEENDKHLFWIARESLKAPLPKDWKPCQSDDGNIYYFNFSTGESIWDHPCDEHYRQLYEREKKKSSGGVGGKVEEKTKPAESRDSSKSPRPQNAQTKPAPTSNMEPLSTSAGLKPLPAVIPSKALAPLQALSGLKSNERPSSNVAPLKTMQTSSSEKPAFLQGSSLGGIGGQNKPTTKVPSSLSHELLNDKSQKSEIVELDVDDEDEDDDDDDNFFTPIKTTVKTEGSPVTATPIAPATVAKSKPSNNDIKSTSDCSGQSEIELSSRSNRTTSVIGSKTETKQKQNTLADNNSQSEIALSSINQRATAVVETKVESIKQINSDSEASISEDLVSPFVKPNKILGNVKKDADPISRALNRLSDDSDLDDRSNKSDELSKRKPARSSNQDEKNKTKKQLFDDDDDEEDDVSDFDDDDDPLSSLLPDAGKPKKPTMTSTKPDELSYISEVSSVEPFTKANAVTSVFNEPKLTLSKPTGSLDNKLADKITSKVIDPPDRPPSSTKADRSPSKSTSPGEHSGSLQLNTFGLDGSTTKLGSSPIVNVISPKANQILGLDEKKGSVQGLNTLTASNASLKARHVLGLPGSGSSSPKLSKRSDVHESSSASSPVSSPKHLNTVSTKVKVDTHSHEDDNDDEEVDDETSHNDTRRDTDSAISPKLKQVLGLPEDKHHVEVQGLNAVSASNASLKARHLLGLPTSPNTESGIKSPVTTKIQPIAEKLTPLRAELEAEWDKVEAEERAKFEADVRKIKKGFRKKLDEAEEAEEEKLRATIKEIKALNQKNVEDIRSGNEAILNKLKRDFVEEEKNIRIEGEKGLAEIRKSGADRMEKLMLESAGEFEAFQDEIQSKYRTKKLQSESQELQKYDTMIRDIQAKHELQLAVFKEKLKQSQEATLTSNLENLSELERIKYDNELEAIRQKYEIQLAEYKAKEQRKFETARFEIESSTEDKIHEIREASRKRVAEERTMADKTISLAEEDAKNREAMERTKIQMENSRQLEKIRLELESEVRKAELDLRQKCLLELETLKIISLKEAEENKQKITNDHSRMLTALEAEYTRKVEDIKTKLYMGEKEEELKVIMDTEQELASRKAKIEAQQHELAQLERDVEYTRQRVTLEKEALVQMERSITGAMAKERNAFRNAQAADNNIPQVPQTTSPSRPLAYDQHSEMMAEDALSANSIDISSKLKSGKSLLKSLTHKKIDRLVDAAFGAKTKGSLNINLSDESDDFSES